MLNTKKRFAKGAVAAAIAVAALAAPASMADTATATLGGIRLNLRS